MSSQHLQTSKSTELHSNPNNNFESNDELDKSVVELDDNKTELEIEHLLCKHFPQEVSKDLSKDNARNEFIDHQTINDIKETQSLERTLIHQCCLDQNPSILELLIGKIETACLDDYQTTKEILEMKDQFGNTPLMLALVYDNKAKVQDQVKCIEILLKNGADPNGINKNTGFTPLHWAARYGNLQIVKMLCEGIQDWDYDKKKPIQKVKQRGSLKKTCSMSISSNNIQTKKIACQFIPDFKGYTPLDYAGFFRHYELVKYFVKSTSEQSKKAIQEYKTKKEEEQQEYLKQIDKLLLINPLIRSNLLFWASILKEQDLTWEELQNLIDDLECYPESINDLDKERTSIHSASIEGNWQKLKVLLLNISQRYLQEKAQQSKIIDKNKNLNKLKDFDDLKYEKLLKDQLKKHKFGQFLKKYYNLKKRIQKLQKDSKNQTFDINFVDDEGLSPLHYACQYKKKHCAEILLIEYGLSIDLSGESGFRSRELLHYEVIRQLFQRFYLMVDTIAGNDKGLSDIPGSNFAQRNLQILQKQYKFRLPEKITLENLDELDYSEEKDKMLRQMSYRNVIDFYSKRFKKEAVTHQLDSILNERKWLPEVSVYAILVNIENELKKKKINSMIKTFLKSKFTVRMFPAAQNPKSMFFIVLDLEQDDLEKEAQNQQYEMKMFDQNLKFKYIQTMKEKFEPFRSKDIQSIIQTVVYNVINIPDLQRKGVVIKSFYIHQLNEISDIEDKFRNTSVFEQLKYNFIDWKPNEYLAFTAIKNYLGERWGFMYAFENFYTVWLSLPAILGLYCSAYVTYQNSYITLQSYSFAVFMMIWITIFQEKWIRKQNELKMLWGTIVEEEDTDSNIRPQFQGYEEFSHSNDKVNLKSNIYIRAFWQIVNVITMILFITICVTSFYYSKQGDLFSKESPYAKYVGVANGVIIGVTDFCYMMCCNVIMRKENHKLEEDYNSSFIKKIFIFKFINANVSLIWTVYKERELEKLNNILLGQIIIKIIANFNTKAIVPYIIGKGKKYLYFKKCQAHSKNQDFIIDKYFREPMYTQQQIHKVAIDQNEKKETEIFQHLKTKNYQWKRLLSVFSPDKNVPIIEQEPYLIDQIELNSTLKIVLTNYELSNISNTFILFGYVTMYSFICPGLAAIVFISNVCFAKYERQAHLMANTRLHIVKMNGLGAWIDVLGYLSYATVLMNCLFMYWFRDDFISYVQLQILDFIQVFFPKALQQYGNYEGIKLLGVSDQSTKLFGVSDKDMLDFCILIVLTEHLILGIRFILQDYINDVPAFVTKQIPGINSKIEEMNHLIKDIKIEQDIKTYKNQISRQKNSFKKLLKQAESQYEKIQKELVKVKDKYSIYIEDHQEKQKRVDNLQQNKIENKEQEKPKKLERSKAQLFHFFEYRLDFQCPENDQDKFEFIIKQQLQNRMYRQSYYYIERHILQNRLQKLCNQDNHIVINCTRCQEQLAEVQCHNCQNDSLCQICFDKLHKNEQLKNHMTSQLKYKDINKTHEITIELKNDTQFKNNTNQWQKYEQFNFVLNQQNEYFMHLRIKLQIRDNRLVQK